MRISSKCTGGRSSDTSHITTYNSGLRLLFIHQSVLLYVQYSECDYLGRIHKENLKHMTLIISKPRSINEKNWLERVLNRQRSCTWYLNYANLRLNVKPIFPTQLWQLEMLSFKTVQSANLIKNPAIITTFFQLVPFVETGILQRFRIVSCASQAANPC